MPYEVNEAKRLVIEAGKKLIENGLIARTWGNVSARISDTQYCITPSGMPYETLTPDKIVVVNIADNSYEGDIKPSTEKKLHSKLYALRPDVDFMIHTHQKAASAISTTGTCFAVPEEYQDVLGKEIPTADYGLAGTKTLTENVWKAAHDYPDSKAILMAHHGTTCMGKDVDEAFAIAEALERTAEGIIADVCSKAADTEKTYDDLAEVFTDKIVPAENRTLTCSDLGNSVSKGTRFTLAMKDGSVYDCSVLSGTTPTGDAPLASLLHAAIYRKSDVRYIHHRADPETVAVSKMGQDETPYLDDFAQIAGKKVPCLSWDCSDRSAKMIASAIGSNSAIFLAGYGALCTGNTDDNAGAVELVLEKECKASMYAALTGDADTLKYIGRFLDRTVYVMKYSKIADED